MISQNYEDVKKKMEDACKRCGRDPSEITLIAVSKTMPVPCLLEAYEAGAVDFGENKVQEILEKTPQLPDDIRWHMIGHLQRNKVKQVIDKAVLIHAVDSVRLARQIEEDAAKRELHVDVLLEVNIAREESKYGFLEEEIMPALSAIKGFPHIHIKGFMTIAPFVDDPEENRQYFRKLKQLCVDTKSKNIDNVNMDILSMGMTGDYEVAVEEGATMIRVGTGIFGTRKRLEK